MYLYSGALKGLLYPHILPNSRPEISLPVIHPDPLSQRTPNTLSCPPASIDLMPELYTKLDSKANRAAKMAKEHSADLPTFSQQEIIVGTYAGLATTPEVSGDDVSLDFNPYLPPRPVVTPSALSATSLPRLPETPLSSPADVSVKDLPDPPRSFIATPVTENGTALPYVPNSPTSSRAVIQSHATDPLAGSPIATPEIVHTHASEVLPKDPITSPPVLMTHRRSPSPLGLAVDAAADGQELSDIPDSPSDGRPSFDTLVRDLVQSRPDSPIGGHAEPPMFPPEIKRSFNVRSFMIKRILTPRIEISCADTESAVTGSMNRPLMFTALESRENSRTDGSDAGSCMDEFQLPISEVGDFGLATDGSRSKKTSKVPDHIKIDKSEQDPKPSGPEDDPDYCEDCVSPLTKAPKKDEHTEENAVLVKPAKENAKKRPNTKAKSGGDQITEKKEAEAKTGKKRKMVENMKALAAIPMDITGKLTPPETPKPKKRAIIKAKGHMAIRKCRGMVIRTPVANALVGRFVFSIISTLYTTMCPNQLHWFERTSRWHSNGSKYSKD